MIWNMEILYVIKLVKLVKASIVGIHFFSDSKLISNFGSNHKQYVWKRSYNSDCLQSVKHCASSVMVWGCMSASDVGILSKQMELWMQKSIITFWSTIPSETYDWQQLHFSARQWSQKHSQCSKSTPGLK